MNWLARIYDVLAPFIFGGMALVFLFLIVQGVSDGAVAFGTSRRLYRVQLSEMPLFYSLVMLLYTFGLVCCLRVTKSALTSVRK